jgi:hypothetical protein
VAVGIFAVLALQESLEIVVATADVARFVHGVIEVLGGHHFCYFDDPGALQDLVVGCPAVGTLCGKSAALKNAGEAEKMPAA